MNASFSRIKGDEFFAFASMSSDISPFDLLPKLDFDEEGYAIINLPVVITKEEIIQWKKEYDDNAVKWVKGGRRCSFEEYVHRKLERRIGLYSKSA